MGGALRSVRAPHLEREMTMRGAMMRWVAVLSATAFVGACRCGTDPEVCKDIVVTFENPVENATVPTTIEVTANATMNGQAVNLASAALSTRLVTASAYSTPITGTVSGNKAS